MGIKRKLHVAALVPVVLYKTWRDQCTAAKKWKAHQRNQKAWQEQKAQPKAHVFVPEQSTCKTSHTTAEPEIRPQGDETEQAQSKQYPKFSEEEIAEARRGKKAQTRVEESNSADGRRIQALQG